MRALTSAGWYFSASHRDETRRELHGHSYEVTAYWAAGRDAVICQGQLRLVLEDFDHRVLPPELSLGEDIAAAIMRALPGCVGVDLMRPVERIGAQVRA